MSLRFLAGLAALAIFTVSPARAQEEPPPSIMQNHPAEQKSMTPGGVDLRTGRYGYNATDLSIGGEGQESSLTLARTTVDGVTGHLNPFGNFADNWEIMLAQYLVDSSGSGVKADVRSAIHYAALTDSFDSAGPNNGFAHLSAGADTWLTFTGGARDGASTVFSYTTSDGTVVVFRPLGSNDCSTPPLKCTYASSVTKPDGTVYTLNYSATGASSGNQSRLSSVVSSRGYALILEGTGSFVSKACVLNLAITPMPTSPVCPTGAPSVTYGYSGARLASVTTPSGATSSFAYVDHGYGAYQMKFFKPGQSTPWLTNELYPTFDEDWMPHDAVYSQAFADGRTYSYGYDISPADSPPYPIVGGRYQDNQGHGAAVAYAFPIKYGTGPGAPCTLPCTPVMIGSIVYLQTPGPVGIADELGRVTTFDYCNPTAMASLGECFLEQLQSFTDPEGIKTKLTYAGRNITSVRRIAKPGSGLADIVTSATYSCANAKVCAKPTSITDALGNITTYDYKLENGEPQTVTKPADANGVQPVTRYAYVQRKAWISNGSGGYSQVSDPVWLLSTVKTCRTTATVSGACSGGSTDEMVTTYEYGPDSGPNNLLLRGKAVTADGTTQRTCYAYDSLGNKVSETSPRGTASLSVCP